MQYLGGSQLDRWQKLSAKKTVNSYQLFRFLLGYGGMLQLSKKNNGADAPFGVNIKEVEQT